MGQDSSSNLDYYLLLNEYSKNSVGHIRQWENLSAGFENGFCWIKGFSFAQINSIELKIIPNKQLFYEREGRLCFVGSHLPERLIPEIGWKPIAEVFHVKLPKVNFNFFELKERLGIELIDSMHEQSCSCLKIPLNELVQYMEVAPANRYSGLLWCITEGDYAIVLGTPLLPLDGEAYWRRADFLYPAGYQLEFEILEDHLQSLICPEKNQYIFWAKEAEYFTIAKENFVPLSRSSVRLSTQKIAAG